MLWILFEGLGSDVGHQHMTRITNIHDALGLDHRISNDIDPTVNVPHQMTGATVDAHS